MTSSLAAILADRKNTRVALATALVAANEELLALRTERSIAQAPVSAPTPKQQAGNAVKAALSRPVRSGFVGPVMTSDERARRARMFFAAHPWMKSARPDDIGNWYAAHAV